MTAAGARPAAAVEERRQRGIELPIRGMRVAVAGASGPGDATGRRRTVGGHRVVDGREPARGRPPPGAQRRTPRPRSCSTVAISASRTSARIWRQSGLAMPPPDARICAGAGMPAATISSRPSRSPKATPSRTARVEVAPVVRERQPDERAARERVGVRAAFAREVGQEQQPVAAGGDSPAAVATRVPNATPGAIVSRNQRRLPAAESITDMRCQRSGTAWQNAWTRPSSVVQRRGGRGEDHAGRAEATAPRCPGPRRRRRRRSRPGRRRPRPPACRLEAPWPRRRSP